MERRRFLKSAGIGTAAMILGGKVFFTSCAAAGPPNIVLIFVDDQGYADLGCYGAKGFVTPHLDSIAREGIRLTDFHVAQAVCSASRASLLTGCYSERVGIKGALNPWARNGLNPEEETIAKLLKQRGYATAIFGKWHLGHEKEFLPLNHGFDEYFGLPYSNDMWPVDFDGKPVQEGHKSIYPRLPLMEGNEIVGYVDDLEDQSQLTTLYTERAVRFIEKNKDKPFFLYLPHSMVHVPLGVSDKFRGKSAQGMFGDVMMEVDWSVGQIMETLKKNNLDQNTLVIYTSDNGPWLNFGNHAGSAFPLREGKGNMWEGGNRVPCIMRWPGRIPADKVCDKLTATLDILPTICTLAGVSHPAKKIDGVNIWPLISGSDEHPRNQFYYYYEKQLCGVREGDWKLMFPHPYRSYAGVETGRDGFPGPYAEGICGLELYNLRDDIGETTDVADRYPEIVERLKKIGDQARASLGDALTGVQGTEVREPGRTYRRKETTVKHKAIGKAITLKDAPHPRYTGKGAEILVNGRYGSDEFSDGQWLGFEGINFEATIDLGEKTEINSIACSTLQNQVSWIFLPAEVSFYISGDGKSYKELKSINEEIRVDQETKTREFQAENIHARARYVRVGAKNVGKCPDWHPGAGGKAWIFVDEIVIQ